VIPLRKFLLCDDFVVVVVVFVAPSVCRGITYIYVVSYLP
jgi:hypothetical protein